MPVIEKISSFQNPRVKQVVKMHRSGNRRQDETIIVEGVKEVMMATRAGHEIRNLMVCPALFPQEYHKDISGLIDENICFEVSKPVFEKMAYREHSGGVLATIKATSLSLDQIKLSPNPLLIVLESVEKPGNLGAVLRTAEAAAVDAVIICDPLTDIYNPNVIRSSLGCVFTKQVVVCTSGQALQWLLKNNIEPIASSLRATENHYQSDLAGSLAFIMGTEADGLSNFWLDNVQRHIKIPMHGKIDSLNVSVSTAILVYEAIRQREFAR